MNCYTVVMASCAVTMIAAAARGDLVVDDFTTGSFSETIFVGSSSSSDAGTMLGGERDSSYGIDDNMFDLGLTVSAGGGLLSYETGFGVDGFLILSYDGVGTAGLGGIDVSGESSLDVDVLGNDLPMLVVATLVDDTGASQSLPAMVTPGLGQVASFGLAGYDAVDLTSIDAVVLEFDMDDSLFLSLDFVLGGVAFSTDIPAPGALALLGLAGLAARRRRRAG